jgi:hypothetical protein
MSNQYSNSLALNGQPQDIHNKIGENLITPQQALITAARACNALLFGTPSPASFDRDDLSQTLAILTQMASTIEPTKAGEL